LGDKPQVLTISCPVTKAELEEPEVEPQLTIDDILVMTVEELRIECLCTELDAIGLTKPAIQRLFLADVGATTTSTSAGQVRQATQPEPLSPHHAPLPDDDTCSTKAMSERHSPSPADQTSGSGEIRFKFQHLGVGLNQQGLVPSSGRVYKV